jgi:hypothetical protein
VTARHEERVRTHSPKRAAGGGRALEGPAATRPARCPGAAAQLAALHRTLRQGPVAQLHEEDVAANRTGLPDRLKSGIEALSGLSLDDVRVHYNSSKPAQLQAFAYTQGSDIHVAPGHEQHLPHDAWYMIQQKQGRVKPTMQLKEGVPINDDAGLEREANAMGAKALSAATRYSRGDQPAAGGLRRTKSDRPVAQLVKVGGSGASVIFLAQTRFEAVYDVAKTVLEELKKSDKDFTDIDAIVAAVDADERVKDAKAKAAEAVKAAEAAEAARKAAAEVRHDLGKGVKLTQGDIDAGIWEPIPDRDPKTGDYQLRVKLSGVEYSYHVHPPKFKNGDPIPGALMEGGSGRIGGNSPSTLPAILSPGTALRKRGANPPWQGRLGRQELNLRMPAKNLLPLFSVKPQKSADLTTLNRPESALRISVSCLRGAHRSVAVEGS